MSLELHKDNSGIETSLEKLMEHYDLNNLGDIVDFWRAVDWYYREENPVLKNSLANLLKEEASRPQHAIDDFFEKLKVGEYKAQALSFRRDEQGKGSKTIDKDLPKAA